MRFPRVAAVAAHAVPPAHATITATPSFPPATVPELAGGATRGSWGSPQSSRRRTRFGPIDGLEDGARPPCAREMASGGAGAARSLAPPFLGMVDEEDGDDMAALQLAQEGEHRCPPLRWRHGDQACGHSAAPRPSPPCGSAGARSPMLWCCRNLALGRLPAHRGDSWSQGHLV